MRSMAWLVGLAMAGCSSDYKVETDLDPTRGPSTSTMTMMRLAVTTATATKTAPTGCSSPLAGSCAGLQDAGTPCDSNINSVHFLGEAVCLVPVS